ncbi:hypothetical protein JW935_03645 [candidate division KSB1 bacterium]|nr:hypothetical protein [candidate division KSB1 bacterium]
MIRNKILIFGLLFMAVVCPAQPQGKLYTDQYLTSLRVPVGGVGTGDILMGGRGNIEFVEIFNRPDRSRRLEKTFFALWFQQGEKKAVAKILERELFPPFRDSTHKYVYGLPRMRQTDFFNTFPLYLWTFRDEDIPIKISMEAFSPFIPLDVARSSYPVVAFYWDITNTTPEPVRGSLVFNMENPIEAKAISNVHVKSQDVQGIHFIADEAEDINYRGSLLMVTSAGNADIQTHWYPGQWRDEAHIFWDDFSDDGSIESKLETWKTAYRPTSYNRTTRRMASVLVHFDLEPDQHIRIPFYLAWYFPKRIFEAPEVFGIPDAANQPFENFYGTLFSNENDVLTQFMHQEKALYLHTAQFAGLISNSSYPSSVKEALTTQIASLRTHLIQVTGDLTVHGFEGVLENGWCCPGTCTHVWNYEQTLASLFPSLERSMREIEFLHDTFDNGFQTHRSVIPLGDYWFDGPAAADGQMGTIVRAYREWKISGDNEWLKKIWPGIKKALEFAWTGPGVVGEARFKHQEGQMAWDPQKSGILSGRQHNTYDINFYGPSSMTTSIYLAALKACVEMAAAMNEPEKAQEYLTVYQNGVKITQDSLWNGSYFIQIVTGDTNQVPETNNHPKYQYGDGCLADQLLGQYLAFISGLGYIMDPSKVNSAIKAIYDFNFIRPLRSFANVQRVYGLNDEAGVVLCTWPNGNRPALPFVYSDEIWTGVEFQVAASLFFSGFVKEGLEIVDAVQDRYDGYKRNPFEHDESGVHYARAMASWSVLLALSGFEYDGIKQSMAFDPKLNQSDFSTFWSTGSAWGNLTIQPGKAILSVEFGELDLKQFSIKEKSWEQTIHLSAGEQLVFKLE